MVVGTESSSWPWLECNLASQSSELSKQRGKSHTRLETAVRAAYGRFNVSDFQACLLPSTMAAQQHREILKKGTSKWNRLRSQHLAVAPDLRNADLRKVDLTGREQNFASLHHATLASANLKNANLRGAHLEFADFDNALGVDAICKPKGKISENFLRDCGVPETLIRYMPSLVNSEEGIQFYSCFISYSSKDEEFARRLHGRMRDAHLRVWFAPEDIQGGQKLHEQIETAIRVYDKLLIVLSEASLQSEWVITELRKARKAERQSGKRKLFPVRLMDFETLREWECFDADGGKELAVELREYFIPDFSNLKDHFTFESAIGRLLKDLQGGEVATS